MGIFASWTITASSISLKRKAQLSLTQVWSALQISQIMGEAAFVSFVATSSLKILAHLGFG
jgi:hypothetical protein